MRLIPTFLVCLIVQAVSGKASANTVSNWCEFSAKIVSAAGPVSRGADGAHAETQVALAMFEALNAIDRRYESYLDFPAGDPAASQTIAAATAAYTVLRARFPAQGKTLEDGYTLALLAEPEGPAKEAGRLIGKAAGEAALAAGGIDPAIKPTPYRPRATPGVWAATALPVLEPYLLTLRPWIIGRADAVRPGPPPSLSSRRWAEDYNEVKTLGAASGSTRTEEQTLLASYRIVPELWPSLRAIADAPGRSLVRNARLYALVSMADDDAIVAVTDAKLHYNFWRPIVAIRNGADDGNRATAPDAGWTPLIQTPNHPEYPCGHCIRAAASGAVLKAEVGEAPPGGLRVQSGLHISPVQVVPTIDEWVSSVSNSRIYGGVHYRFSNDVGEEMGRRIGEMATGSLMQSIDPE